MSRPIAPLGNRFGRASQVSKELKKTCLLERRAGRRRHNACGSGNPSPQLYSARAPIHPKRPYGLTRPVVPPDGSLIFSKPLFLFAAVFRWCQIRVNFPHALTTPDMEKWGAGRDDGSPRAMIRYAQLARWPKPQSARILS